MQLAKGEIAGFQFVATSTEQRDCVIAIREASDRPRGIAGAEAGAVLPQVLFEVPQPLQPFSEGIEGADIGLSIANAISAAVYGPRGELRKK